VAQGDHRPAYCHEGGRASAPRLTVVPSARQLDLLALEQRAPFGRVVFVGIAPRLKLFEVTARGIAGSELTYQDALATVVAREGSPHTWRAGVDGDALREQR